MRNELIERWKAEVYLDLNEQRNPGTDEFAKGFNGGIIKARDTIYAKLPALLAAYDTDDRIKELEARIAEGHGLMLAALGFYRDDMPPEAVKRFQELLTALKGGA